MPTNSTFKVGSLVTLDDGSINARIRLISEEYDEPTNSIIPIAVITLTRKHVTARGQAFNAGFELVALLADLRHLC